MSIYAAGLRISEACQLQIADLLGDRHQIRVIQGKGQKDRYTIFWPRLQEELRGCWRRYLQQNGLFIPAGFILSAT